MQKQCIRCKKEQSLDSFYKRKNGSPRSYCEKCTTLNRRKCRRIRNDWKVQLVELHGGHCLKCGYKKCIAALQFHHRNPKTKLFAIGCDHKYGLEEMITESKKCDLLCANCHIEEHYNLTRPK
jgi:hypothetical protein